ncbi:MAG: hypothetical protein ABL914_04350 [Novosphingobium sp.]
MREGLNHWQFVYAAYAFGVGGTIALIWHSLAAMRRAEAQRERSRES